MREKRTSSESRLKRETHRAGDQRSSTTIIFADVINSTHTGCLSHFTIEEAELSTPERTERFAWNQRENSAVILEERRKSPRKSNKRRVFHKREILYKWPDRLSCVEASKSGKLARREIARSLNFRTKRWELGRNRVDGKMLAKVQMYIMLLLNL